MKKLLVIQKIAFTLIILASSLLIWGCQPEGGELLPIGGEGVELTTSRFKNDTVFIKNDNLKIKLYGTWTGSGYIHLRVGINNESSKSLKIHFDKIILTNKKNQNWKISTINRKPDFNVVFSNSKDKNLPVIEIKETEKNSFIIEFAPLINFSNADDEAKKLKVILPIEFDGKTIDYQSDFEVSPQKIGKGESDPEDW